MLIVPLGTIINAYASHSDWQDFENNIYVGAGYLNNTGSGNGFGERDNGGANLMIGATSLFNNHVWLNIEGNTAFNSGNIKSNYDTSAKIGYSIQTSHLQNNFNFIPYAKLGIGSGGAYYSTTTNINYGIGLLSELMLNRDWLVYLDINSSLQNYDNSLATDFNNNVINGLAIYDKVDSSYSYGLDLGAKYITNSGFYINPFFKYQIYEQSLKARSNIDFGTVDPTTKVMQLGVAFGILI